MHQFDLCRWLYNHSLGDRIAAYKTLGKSISHKDQQNELSSLKEDYPGLNKFIPRFCKIYREDWMALFNTFFAGLKRAKNQGFQDLREKTGLILFATPSPVSK